MKNLIALFLVCFIVSNLVAQKQHVFYGGTTFVFNKQNQPRQHIDSLEEMRGLASGANGNLNYDGYSIPLLSIGYIYKRNLRKHPEFGFYGGLELNSRYSKSWVVQDNGYYEFYRWWGFYPSTSPTRQTQITAYASAGLNYRMNKLSFFTGLSTIVLEMDFPHQNKFRFEDVFSGRILNLRCSYDFNKRFSMYSDFKTTLHKEYYVRSFYVGLGIQWNSLEKPVKRHRK